MCVGNPRCELGKRHEIAQAGPFLVRGVEKQALGPGALCRLDHLGPWNAGNAIGIRVCDGNDPRLRIAGLCALDSRGDERFHASRGDDACEANFDKYRTRFSKFTRRSFDGCLAEGVTQCRCQRTCLGDDAVNLAQDVDRHGTECTRLRILGIDHIGTTGQRRRCLGRVCHAHQKSHNAVTVSFCIHDRRQKTEYGNMNTAIPLVGRAMLVTGASSGIGRAIALAGARAGADVAVTYRANERGARDVEREVRGLGRRAAVLRVDLTDEASIAALGPAVRNAFGRVDVWVNNAGADVLTGSGAALSDIEKLDLLLTVDLRGTILGSWEAARLLGAQENGGVIINMSWDHVLTGMPGLNPQLFAAVKGGIAAFSKSLARSVAPRVRVNVLAPGWIATSFSTSVPDGERRAISESTPLKRWGTPEDVAAAAIFLASPGASFLTGQTILVGGGVVM